MISEQIAKYIRALELVDTPKEVSRQAKRLILDTLSTTVRGRYSEEAEILRQIAPSLGSGENSTVVLDINRYPEAQAAMVNAVMAHAYELDDTDRRTYYHPGSPIISAALAVAEKEQVPGDRLIEAVIAGYEISIRIADAVNPSHRTRGYHTTGTVGTFGAGVAVAKLLDLNDEQIQFMLGHCGTQAAGLFEFLENGSMTKRLHPGKAAWNGVFAARLAQAGMTSPKTILEGKHGLLKVMADQSDPSMLTDRLGENYRILRVGIKRHAACRYAHTPIDAAIELQREKRIDVEKIESVTIRMSERNFTQTGKATADTLVGAQLSSPYAVAVALCYGSASIDVYEQGLANPQVLKLMGKITAEAHEPFGGFGREVAIQIKMSTGDILNCTADLPKGEPELPLSEEELDQKVIDLMSCSLTEDRIHSIMQRVKTLEGCSTIGELMDLFRISEKERG